MNMTRIRLECYNALKHTLIQKIQHTVVHYKKTCLLCLLHTTRIIIIIVTFVKRAIIDRGAYMVHRERDSSIDRLHGAATCL